ncbi:MAG: hypothetical protein EP338_03715 [Bacteroidetes bacterium]|nr:MAG: hypothetical protein EP338_03715 [Bacteroidota bacterium]
MTAVAGILNKQGVAIAADSAVTISGPQNRKVYNSANKIFTLSKYHPVGIVIYNNAQFMGVPWEIIIKEYRKKLKNKSFSTLYEYKVDFFDWMKDNKFFIEEETDSFLFFDFLSFTQAMINEFLKRKGQKDLQQDLPPFIDDYISNEIPKHKKLDSLKSINKNRTLSELKKFVPKILSILNENLNTNFKPQHIENKLVESYYAYLTHDQFLQFTGLIFIGFGNSEIFPRLYPINVSIVIDSNLRYKDDEENSAIINNVNSSCIRPFAQTDVIDTILQGISPELNYLSSRVFVNFIREFTDEIKLIKNMPTQVLHHMENLKIDKYLEKYQNQFNTVVKQRYVQPLMEAVSQLSKEDLAEMAESLVYLTYLKRRFTMAEESVGGPVDIAVITKGDGFIWIKRKHYFDPKLNQSFFQKYF